MDKNKFKLTDLKNAAIQQPDTFAIKQYLAYCTFLEVDNNFLISKIDDVSIENKDTNF